MTKEVDFINAKRHGQKVQYPHFLYKYRSFDSYTLDMLENEYLYLCPAENLDDPSECIATISDQDIVALMANPVLFNFKCIDLILDRIIKPYTTKENFEQVKQLVYSTVTPTGIVRRNCLLEIVFDIQNLVPNFDIAPLVNYLGTIPEKLNDPQVQRNIKKLFFLADDAHKYMGICSLTELDNSEKMWVNYANHSTGYCVEYDMREYDQLFALYPVVYQDNRETSIGVNIIETFIGEMIFGISNGQIQVDQSHLMRMFLTKDTKWSYQKEWRLLGDANQKIKSPTIHAVYLGKNASHGDKQIMKDYCFSHNIPLIQKDK